MIDISFQQLNLETASSNDATNDASIMDASGSEVMLLVEESISDIESISTLEPEILSDQKEITEEAQEPNWVSLD